MKDYKEVLKALEEMKKDTGYNALELYVIDDLIDEGENVLGYIKDVLNHGCISGTCRNLIYYKETYNFFDEYYSEIMDLLSDLKDGGLDFDIAKDGDIKNTGAWLAYEETIRQIADILEIEY